MRCEKIKFTGEVAPDGSLVIDCPLSVSGTSRTCNEHCPGIEPRQQTLSEYGQTILAHQQARIDNALGGGCCGG